MSFNNASVVLCASRTSLHCKINTGAYMKEQEVVFEVVMYGSPF